MNADGTLWRTLKTLVTRPGELTAAYMRGERVRYMKPLQLFVLVSVAYFVVTGITGTRAFDTPLRLHMRDPRIGYTAQRLVIKRAAERGMPLEAYATTFDRAATTQAKSLVIVMVPAFALLVGILELWRRRFALQHLIFALHTYALLLIVNVAIDVGPLTLMRLISRVTESLDAFLMDQAIGVIIIGSMSAYLYLALRRAYGDGSLSAALKTLVLVSGIVVILVAYRYLLFFTTFWAT